MDDDLETNVEPFTPKVLENNEGKGGAMLDVHPPTAAIHGWKDFFVHIATITIGLLIAIGLEQTVEYVHHLEQLRTVRYELAKELDENRQIATANDAEFVRVGTELNKDMEILRASQNGNSPTVGGLNYTWKFRRTPDGAWQAANRMTRSPYSRTMNCADTSMTMRS